MGDTMGNTRFVRIAVSSCLLLSSGAGMAGSASLDVSATVISKHNCLFQGNTSALSFGAIDPLGSGNATATTTVSFVCHGNPHNALAYTVSHDGGQYDTLAAPSPKMLRQTAPFDPLPYSLNLTPTNGTAPTNTQVDITVTGTILATDYQNARAGAYQDIVILTVAP